MATGLTENYKIPYPVLTDPVNVHEDIQSLAEKLELILSNVGLPFLSIEVKNNSGVTISKGDPVYITGYSTKPTIAKSQSLDIETFPIAGIAQGTMGNGDEGIIITSGTCSFLDTSSYSAGDILYVGETGGLTNVLPNSNVSAIAVVAKSNSVNGMIIVGSVKGNGTWGSLARGLA